MYIFQRERSLFEARSKKTYTVDQINFLFDIHSVDILQTFTLFLYHYRQNAIKRNTIYNLTE